MIDGTSNLSTVSAMEQGESAFEHVRRELSNVGELLASESPSSLTEATLNDLIKQLNGIVQAINRMPSESIHMYMRSRDAVITHLRNGIIELHMAVNQLATRGRTARFYKHLCIFEEYFDKVRRQTLPETHNQQVIGNVFLFSARQQDLTEYAPGNFITQLWRYRKELISAQMALQELSQLFCEADIWPDQCEHSLAILRAASALLKALCGLFNVPPSLQHEKALSLAGQELLIALRYTGEHTRALMALIATFRSLCRSKSRRAVSLKQEITDKLDLLTRSNDDIIQKMQQLTFSHDEVRFQRRFHAPTRQHYEV